MKKARLMGQSLPEEIVIEILKRLPVRLLARFKLVSKSWDSIISNLGIDGTNVFISRYPPRSIDFKDRDLTVIRRHRISGVTAQNSLRIMATINGLVCMLVGESTLILYNPTTMKERSIRLPEDYDNTWCGFGLDPTITNRYKLVAQVPDDDDNGSPEFHVFTITSGTNEASNPSEIPCGDVQLDEWELGKYLNGALHWLCTEDEGMGEKRIVRLDLRLDVTGEFPTPNVVPGNSYNHLSTVHGCLSLTSEEAGGSLGIWVMSRYGDASSWNRVMLIPVHIVNSTYLVPLAFRFGAEILCNIEGNRLQLYSPGDHGEPLVDVYNGSYDEEEFDAAVYVESMVSP